MSRIILIFLLTWLLCLPSKFTFAGSAQPYLDKGWQQLVKDNDTIAFRLFGKALEIATEEKDTAGIANSLLYMGICSYSVSYSEGLHYCLLAIDEFKKLETSDPEVALAGRSKCLQLISTIYSRQGKYRDAIDLSHQAMEGFVSRPDTGGYPGLIFSSLGNAYTHLGMNDSADYYFRRALDEHLKNKNYTYLPGAYQKVAELELKKGNNDFSKKYFDLAVAIADSTGNRQALVNSLLGFTSWIIAVEKNFSKAEAIIQKANFIASGLTDKSYTQKVLMSFVDFYKRQGDFKIALSYNEKLAALSDSLSVWEKDRIVKQLEVQFEVSEKDRQLKLVQKENAITRLTNYLLWGTIAFILIISSVLILFLRRINRRDKLLLQTREELMTALEEQKVLKEKQLQNELEFKESQLSAMALQMMQKNELLDEVKQVLDKDKSISESNEVHKLINKGHNQESEWEDFNTRFESINRNFYSRIKTAYPEISPNDLRLCALIKLNLSIKEMAGILNISPDSVKTARYRLRKKLQMNTEDNLTEFILSL